jgi:hypothetical protein
MQGQVPATQPWAWMQTQTAFGFGFGFWGGFWGGFGVTSGRHDDREANTPS